MATDLLHSNLDSKLFDYQPASVSGKSVLITGGTTGIGRSTALLLASQGARVLIFGRHQQELKDAITDIAAAGGQVSGLTADTADPEDIRRVFKEVDQQFDTLDILINNAGISFESVMKGDYKDWQYVLNTNLLAYLAFAHEAVERMKPHKQGHIVNIGSMSADERGKDSSVYVATKSGIQGFSESLSKEVNPFGIKVTLIEPGTVGTNMQPESPQEQRKLEAELKMLKAEDIAACIFYVLTQPKRSQVSVVQIRQLMQESE